MKLCQNCNMEYEDYISRCSDCGSILVNEHDFVHEKNAQNEAYELKLLYTASNNPETDIICALLETNDIVTEIRRKGSGSYLNIATGFNYQGNDIYVPAYDLSRALELLEGETMVVDDNTELIEDSTNELVNDEHNYNESIRNTVRFTILIMFIVPLILILASVLYKVIF